MRIKQYGNTLKIWISERDIYNWVHRPGESWICSTLEGNRLFVEYDKNGLCDLMLNGKYTDQFIDANELNALINDLLPDKVKANHPFFL